MVSCSVSYLECVASVAELLVGDAIGQNTDECGVCGWSGFLLVAICQKRFCIVKCINISVQMFH